MHRAWLAAALLAGQAAALAADAARPRAEDIAEVTVDEEGLVMEGNWRILNKASVSPQEVEAAVRTYHVVTQDAWSHYYSHVARMDSTGLLKLTDGTKIRWMMRPGGLLVLRYPDGRWVYLAAEITFNDYQDEDWALTDERSPWLQEGFEIPDDEIVIQRPIRLEESTRDLTAP
jgi:hypothetical protein